MKAQGLMGTAAEGGGLTEGNPAVESAWLDKDFRIPAPGTGDGSASFAGTVLSHNQISTAMTGVPFAGLPANLNPWPDVYFVSTARHVMSCHMACHVMSCHTYHHDFIDSRVDAFGLSGRNDRHARD